MSRVAVVGAGVAGLAAAHRRREVLPAADVVVLEEADRVGGDVGTEHAGGFTIEAGADAFLTEKPWALALCERIDLAGSITGTNPGDRRTWVVHRDTLAPLPEGFLLLAPTDLRAIATSPLFSWSAKLRMALDLVLPRGGRADESLASFVRRRLGREVLERAAQPLMSGIYTADAERLSLAATMPRFLDIERRYRSLILGLRAEVARAPGTRGTAGARYGLFAAPETGMGTLPTTLARRLPEGALRLRAPVTGLERADGVWRLRAGGEALTADTLIIATPAHVTAGLLAPIDPPLGQLLAGIEHASSATVTLGYRSADLPELRGFGFVVPAVERRALLACTYASRKFRGRAPAGHELLRAFVGGALRPDLAALDDEALVAIVRRELTALVGIQASPVLVRIQRHPRAMPQYAVGHLERVGAIETRVAALPALALAGNAYRGVGIPDCVRSGEAAAEAMARGLGVPARG